jgi:hypothetical protein
MKAASVGQLLLFAKIMTVPEKYAIYCKSTPMLRSPYFVRNLCNLSAGSISNE